MTNGAPVVFDPSQSTTTIDNTYITGFGSTAISFSYNQDAVSAEAGIDGAVVFSKNNAKLGTGTIPMKISSPQYPMMLELAKNGKMFSIWTTDKSSGRRAGGNWAMFTKVPDHTFDATDVTFNVLIADLDIGSC